MPAFCANPTKAMRLLFLLVLACLFPLRADILVNGNFADGRAHWKGDLQDADAINSASLSTSGSSNSGGVVVQLKKDKWTKIYQTFTIRDPKLYYSVTFQLSDDYKLSSHDAQDYSSIDLGDVPGFNFGWSMSERYWGLLVGGGSYSTKFLMPNAHKTGDQQTLTGRLNDLTTDSDAVLVLAFPPGEGSVTLYSISLSATDPNANP
jgi:hypothetical protein